MYIRLIDKHDFVSTTLYIHNDEDEFLAQIEEWKKHLHLWLHCNPKMEGTPLGRLDAGACMIDMIRYLSDYFVRTTPNCCGKVMGGLKLEDYPKKEELRHNIESSEDIIEIKTYE